MLGAVLVIVTGCISDKETYRRMDWNTVFVLAGSMGIAAALDRSGGGRLLADLVLGALGPAVSPFTVLVAVSGLGLVLTQVTSNTAVAAMLAPIALFLSQQMEVSPTRCSWPWPRPAPRRLPLPWPRPQHPRPRRRVPVHRLRPRGGLLNLLVYGVVLLVVPLVWPF